MEVLILGSNSATFAYKRHHTAQVLKHQNHSYLIDCGEGTQLRLKRFKVKTSKLQCIFISHLHGDHYFGLIGLLNTMHLYGRKQHLKIVGPPGLKEILQIQFHHSNTVLDYPITFKEWRPNQVQQVYEDNYLEVSTLPMDHRIPSSGYLFKEKPKQRKIRRDQIPKQLSPTEARLLKLGEDVRNIDGSVKFKSSEVTTAPEPSHSYAFCSDTRYIEALPEMIQEVDLLYHEASFLKDMQNRASDLYHSTAGDAARIAREARVKKLILGHFSSRYGMLEPFLQEAREVFSNTELALEGETFQIQ